MMPLSRDSSPLFVEFGLDGDRRYFEFRSHDDRAVVVGSSPQAHLRIDRYGVSPVAFHLERERDAIYVTPGYGTELRLNTALVQRRGRLSDLSVLEFQGIAVQARILFERPQSAPPPLYSTTDHVRAYQLDQPIDSATVRFAVPGLHPPPPELSTNTLELAMSSAPDEPNSVHDTEEVQFFMTEVLRAPSPGAARVQPPAESAVATGFVEGLEHTLAIERSLLVVPAAPPVSIVSAPPAPPSRLDTVAAAPEIDACPPLSLDAQTTAFEALQAGRTEATPPPPPTPTLALTPGLEEPSDLEGVGWLARLGLLTKAKPLPVMASALSLALLLGVVAANLAMLFTATAAKPKPAAKAGASTRSSATAHGSAARPSLAPSVVSTRPLVATVGSTVPATLERRRSRGQPRHPDLARAVGDLAAGRYPEAAKAYSVVAAQSPDPEVFGAIAALLERASSADCKPSSAAKPFCPEVQK
jgi:hypothetical protein